MIGCAGCDKVDFNELVSVNELHGFLSANVYCLERNSPDVVVRIPKCNTIRYEVCVHVEYYFTQCRHKYNKSATVMYLYVILVHV
jgi:hypothetical protein